MEKHKIILMGGSHHNGLGMVRNFGINGFRPYGVIIGQRAKTSFVRKSKYWEKVWWTKTEREAIELLIDRFSKEEEKPVLITWSDGAAEAVDGALEDLNQYFIIPSINGTQGKIVELMDKSKQVEFAKQMDIAMLKSHVLDFNECNSPISCYPIILKPVRSTEGRKKDIVVVYDRKKFQEAINYLRSHGYDRILVQPYMENINEYVLTGAIDKGEISFTLVKSIRKWPIQGGTGSYSSFVCVGKMYDFAYEVMKKIDLAGYSGPIDIEFFERGDNFYVNEINWRSSGRNYVDRYTHEYSAVWWYCKKTGMTYNGKQFNDVEGYTMIEATDLRHVVYRGISVKGWIRDWRKTNIFALWDREDKYPAIFQYLYLGHEMLYRCIKHEISAD